MQPVAPFSIARATLLCVFLWLPALLISIIITAAGILTFPSAPITSAVAFLLALPAVLVGVRSFRVSALTLIALLLWDVIATTWPHITLAGFFSSLIDVLLLATTVLALLLNRLSTFESLTHLIAHFRRA